MAALAVLERYWQTLRHLKPVQIYGRAWFRLRRPRINTNPAPSLRTPTGTWQTPARRAPSLTAPDQFLFLNETGNLNKLGWDGPERAKLWRYNQHYFDDLNARDAPERASWHISLLDQWVANNPPGDGSGWEPYPTSLRIVNWIKWGMSGGTLSQTHLHSLAVQARWLTQRLETHLLGNHLFANAKALVFAGLWFEGAEADQWRQMGFDILASEVPEQFLPDGGQFELSPMYHALALEDALDLLNICRAFGPALSEDQQALVADLTERIPLMLSWLEATSHPDGGIAFFNDSAFGVAPENNELLCYASRLGLHTHKKLGGLIWLADSGFARLQTGQAVLIADMAKVGPDYLPGHAHADTLSFELSLFGQRVIVNSGTSQYGIGAERHRQRGTPAHSTVTVAGENSSDVWQGFRVGRRARPISPHTDQSGDQLIASASHDGYRHLPGCPQHKRTWRLTPTSLEIEDQLSAHVQPSEARYHLHPAVKITQASNATGRMTLPDGQEISWSAGQGTAHIERSTWHPEFGLREESHCLVVPLIRGCSSLSLDWS